MWWLSFLVGFAGGAVLVVGFQIMIFRMPRVKRYIGGPIVEPECQLCGESPGFARRYGCPAAFDDCPHGGMGCQK